MAYYGVFIPNEQKNSNSEDAATLVFTDKNEAFKHLKKNRESRLKCFDTFEKAEKFSKCGLEGSPDPDGALITFETNGNHLVNNGTSNNCDKITPKVGSEKSSFRCPSSQELVKFRKLIEQGDKDTVHKTVWSNPRFLVSSGDTPTILKESFRYNAVHVATIAKNAEICSMILKTVGDPAFILLLHGRDDHRTAEEVSSIMLDLYLNTPEKGRGETALHLASKFGAASVVEVLTSYSNCQMNTNIEGLLAKDIICSRNEAAGIEVVKKIRTLLEGRFYVPVIRSVDNSLPPVIGEPFSDTQWPNTNGEDLLSPKMEVRAIAGPMNKEQAETFRKRWKTPPRTLSSPASYLLSPSGDKSPMNGSPLSSYPNSLIRQRTPGSTNGTPTASIEKTSRRLFSNDDNGDTKMATLKPLVNAHINMPINLNSAKKKLFRGYRDNIGDESLNDSLIGLTSPSVCDDASFSETSFAAPGFRERNLKLADADKGFEVIGRGLAKDQNIVWREHWAFLNEFIDIANQDGLTKFEKYLQKRLDDKIKPPMIQITQTPVHMASTPVSKICNKLTKLHFARDQTPMVDQATFRKSAPPSPNAFHAYLCVEQSCQIYAKRLLKPITQNPSNIVTVNDVLVGEMARLKSLVCSYKNDIRFYGIDFSATHSRFAHMVIAFLNNSADNETIATLKHTITHILQSKEKVLTNAVKNGINDQSKNAAQLICLLDQFLKHLSGTKNLIFPEILTTESDCANIWQDEYKCDCEWANASEIKSNRNIKRKMGSNRLSGNFADFCTQMNNINLNGTAASYDESMSDEDDDIFMSPVHSDYDSDGSEFDEYFTPPQSPTLEYFDDSDVKIEYDNFIYGPEPTKMDNDVLKALHNVEIDKNSFPNIFSWHSALMKFSLEERTRFPQPPTLTVCLVSPQKQNVPSQVNRTPNENILPRINQFLLKPSKLSTKN